MLQPNVRPIPVIRDLFDGQVDSARLGGVPEQTRGVIRAGEGRIRRGQFNRQTVETGLPEIESRLVRVVFGLRQRVVEKLLTAPDRVVVANRTAAEQDLVDHFLAVHAPFQRSTHIDVREWRSDGRHRECVVPVARNRMHLRLGCALAGCHTPCFELVSGVATVGANQVRATTQPVSWRLAAGLGGPGMDHIDTGDRRFARRAQTCGARTYRHGIRCCRQGTLDKVDGLPVEPIRRMDIARNQRRGSCVHSVDREHLDRVEEAAVVVPASRFFSSLADTPGSNATSR